MTASTRPSNFNVLKLSILSFLAVLGASAFGQPAVMEIPGLFGECKPRYASRADELVLFTSPDLRSARVQLSYPAGWLIPFEKTDGLTRVLTVGEVRIKVPEKLAYCDSNPDGDNYDLQPGEMATYLYYLGEGFAKVRSRGADCQLFVDDDEIVTSPDVQPWIRVLFRDGTSPGWLLNDGQQTIVAGVDC